MKIISWNVNGIRAILKKNFIEFLIEETPDILCLQETKANIEQIQKVINPSAQVAPQAAKILSTYESQWHSATNPGYSGVGFFYKKNIASSIKITEGIGEQQFDTEGRVITLEHDFFFLITAYFPNSQEGLKRLPYKMDFNRQFARYVHKLSTTKPVIACGDFNVAHKEIDLKNPKSNKLNPGFYIDERNWFTQFLKGGGTEEKNDVHKNPTTNTTQPTFIDLFRHFQPNLAEQYTWWSYRFQARTKNVGWRIDYFVIDSSLLPRVHNTSILKHVIGSDHCPIQLTLKP